MLNFCENTVRAPSMRFFSNDSNLVLAYCTVGKTGSTTMIDIIRRAYNLHNNESIRYGYLSDNSRIPNYVKKDIYSYSSNTKKLLSEKAAKYLCDNMKVFSFTTIRNPWDRLISAFIGKVVTNRNVFMGLNRSIPFESFINKTLNSSNIHIIPHYRSCNPHLNYSMVLRMENYNANLKSLIMSTKLNKNKPIDDIMDFQHINSTDKCSKDYYCSSRYMSILGTSNISYIRRYFFNSSLLRAWVRKRYREDIIFGGYKF